MSGQEQINQNTEVKEGPVQRTYEYQYVGLIINEKGNLSAHLDFLRTKARS